MKLLNDIINENEIWNCKQYYEIKKHTVAIILPLKITS